MWYLFNTEGACAGTANGPIAPMDGITCVHSDTVYEDVDNIRLIDGEVVYIKKEENYNGKKESSV